MKMLRSAFVVLVCSVPLARAQSWEWDVLAGNPLTGARDGVGGAAGFDGPIGLAADRGGNLFVLDGSALRMVEPSGRVTTLAGLSQGVCGTEDGTRAGARFGATRTGVYGSLAIDGQGVLYVADQANCTVRKVTPAGVVTTLAGLGGACDTVDGKRSAARATRPHGITRAGARFGPTRTGVYGSLAIDGRGVLYVADRANCAVRKVTPAGGVTARAGRGGACDAVDGKGSAARFTRPNGIAVDGQGNVAV